MIFIDSKMVEYLKTNDYLIIYKDSRRHLTGNRELIMLRLNDERIKIGKCIVTPIYEYINKGNDITLKNTLKNFVAYSGFETVDEWYNYINNEMILQNKKDGGFLYQINKILLFEDDDFFKRRNK